MRCAATGASARPRRWRGRFSPDRRFARAIARTTAACRTPTASVASPQVLGACIDLFRQAAGTLRIEANGATDNPLVLAETGRIASGGNFHGEPVAFAADQIAMAVAETGSIAQRRVAVLVDPALSSGLSPFLSPDPGHPFGADVGGRSAPLPSPAKTAISPIPAPSTRSRPAPARRTMSPCPAHGAWRLQRMVRNLERLLAIEWIAAAAGVEQRAPRRTRRTAQAGAVLPAPGGAAAGRRPPLERRHREGARSARRRGPPRRLRPPPPAAPGDAGVTFDRANARTVIPPTGPERSARSWQTEAPLRMLMNNLHPGGRRGTRRPWSSTAASAARRAAGRISIASSKACTSSATTRPCWCSRAGRPGYSAPMGMRRGC